VTKLIEHLRRQEMIVGCGQLDANERCFNSRNDKEDQGEDDVHQTEPLVVNRNEPGMDVVKYCFFRARE